MQSTWTEPAGSLPLDALKLQAKRWHFTHRPPDTLADWQQQRDQLKAHIRAAAGIDSVTTDLAPRDYGSIDCDGYQIRRLSYQSRPGLRVTANLYVPAGEGPFPAVLGVHGHWPQGKVAARVAARGHELAREGFVVLCVDAFGAGERCTIPGQYEYHGAQLGASLLPLGRTLLGMQIMDNQAGLDLLASLPCVDSERLGVTGASGGGNQTMWLAAMDDRIKAAVPVVSVGTFESYIGTANCICETLPGGLTFMEEWGALALAAPAPLLIMNALDDSSPAFQVKQMIRSANDAARVYELYGKRDLLTYQTFNTPHGYWPEMRSAMLGWFCRWLKGEGEGRPRPIAEYDDLPEEQLLCFPDMQRPAEVISLRDWIKAEAETLGQAAPLEAAAKRQELASLLHVPEAEPGPPRFLTSEHGERWLLETEPGYLVSGQLQGEIGEELVIAVHPDGVAGLRREPAIRQRLDEGRATLLAELRCTGETVWDTGIVKPNHEWARAVLWLGRTAIGEWVHDLQCLVRLAAQRFPDTTIRLVGYETPGLAVLACAALQPRPVTVHRVLHSFMIEDTPPVQDMAIFIPGFLRWGDVDLLVALAGEDVQLESPVDMTNKPLTGDRLFVCRGRAKRLREALAQSPGNKQ